MSGTVAAAAKARLLGTGGLLTTLPGLSGVEVAYSMPREIPREVVFGGTFAGPVSLSAMRGGGRIKREGNVSLQIHIRVSEPGNNTTEATDARAAEIGTAIEEYIAANPTLDALTDLKLAAVESIDGDGWVDEDGATSVLTLQINLKSYLL